MVAQADAVDEFHDDEGGARFFAHVVDRDHVRMIEPRGRSRFPLQPLARMLIAAGASEHLDRDVAVELHVPGAIHRSHAAATDLRVELVASEQGHPALQPGRRGGIVRREIAIAT